MALEFRKREMTRPLRREKKLHSRQMIMMMMMVVQWSEWRLRRSLQQILQQFPSSTKAAEILLLLSDLSLSGTPSENPESAAGNLVLRITV
jgi:hypothetical protein